MTDKNGQRDAQNITVTEMKAKLSRMQALLGEITASVDKIEALGYSSFEMTNAQSPDRAIKDTTSWLRGAMMAATDHIANGPKQAQKPKR